MISCTSKPLSVNRTKISLGTYVKIVIITNRSERELAERTIDQVYALIDTYEPIFDYRGTDGGLVTFNGGTTLNKTDNEQLYNLILQALDLAELTEGYFDPTVLPLVTLWGFDSVMKNPVVPDHEDILKALEQIGYNRVTMRGERIYKPQEIKFDLSGIAKGKIVDMSSDLLLSYGFHDFLVDAGGDIYVSGKNLNRSNWRIAIQDPMDHEQFSGVLEITDSAIVTSGDYENFFVQDGTKYSHLFNPHTGYPDSDILSVTIRTDEAATADAVATAVFSMGKREGFVFLKERDVAGLILYEDATGQVRSLETADFWN
jgi:thiamine biosynthesis lipoprotein